MNRTYRFRLFGVNIESDIEPPAALEPSGPTDLRILCDLDASFVGPPAFSIPRNGPDGRLIYSFRHDREATFLRLDPVADYVCGDDYIAYRPLSPAPRESILWQLYGIVFAVWLERRGFAVFHAAAVEVGDRAVAFLGVPCAGKSTLTAAFIRQGHRVLSDEHLVVDKGSIPIHVLPALPWLKVGPEVARWLGSDHEKLPVLHPATPKRQFNIPDAAFVRQSLPKGCLYALQRDPSATVVSIRPTDLDESLQILIRHTYAPRSVAAAGLDVGRLQVLAQLLDQGKVWRLCYPDGLDRLEEVVAAVQSHCRTISQAVASPASAESRDSSR